MDRQDRAPLPDIARAELTLKQAEEVGFLWSDSKALLEEARKADRAGDHTSASRLAAQAQHQGDMALNQYYLARAKDVRRILAKDQHTERDKNAWEQAEALIRQSEGKASFEAWAALAADRDLEIAAFPAPSPPVEITAYEPAGVTVSAQPSTRLHRAGRPAGNKPRFKHLPALRPSS